MIYLDNAATTFPKPECVYQAMDKANRELAFNAGRGSYKAARDAAAIIDETKSRIANILNASGYADVGRNHSASQRSESGSRPRKGARCY